MTPETFLDQFETFAAAPGGVAKLREMILQLAVQGKLGTQDPSDEPAHIAISRISARKTEMLVGSEIQRDKKFAPIAKSEPPWLIPQSWAWVRLQDIFEISRGGSPRPAGDPQYFGGPIPWITVGEITKDNNLFVTQTSAGLTELGSQRSRFVDPDDLLITNSGATLGVPKISQIRGCINDGVALLRCFHTDVVKAFAYLFLRQQTPAFRNVNQGMGQPNLNTPILAGWYFVFPPLAEQRRIVAKVDQLLGLCDELAGRQESRRVTRQKLVGATLDRLTSPPPGESLASHVDRLRTHFDHLFDTPTTLPQLRQTNHQLAVHGQLVSQDPNDNSVDDLLNSIKSHKLSASKSRSNEIPKQEGNYKIPTNWRWASVGEVVTLKSGFTIAPELELSEGEIPFLRVGDMNLVANQDAIMTSSRFVERSKAIEGQIIPGNSIVFPKRGGAIATNKKRFVRTLILADSNVMAMICPTEFSLEYLSTWLKTIDLAALNTGTSVPQINNKDIAPLPIPVPPLAEQKRIVAKVTELLSLCDALESQLTQAHTASTQLLSATVSQLLGGL